MKRFLFQLAIAFSSFLFSLVGIYIFNFFTQLPEVQISEEIACPLLTGFSESKIRIDYKYTVRDKEFNNGVFLVTNNTNESIYYVSYNKKEHADNWIRQNGKVTTSLICHMGMSEQKLKPFESATFAVPVPKNKSPFEAGFDFYVGVSNKPKTTWVQVKKQSVYVEKSSH